MAMPVFLVFIAVLCIYGRRPLARWSAAELIAGAALGQAISLAMLSRSVPLADGAFAIAILTIIFCGIRLIHAQRAGASGDAHPVLLFRRGAFLPQAIEKCGMTEGAIITAVRARGYQAFKDVEMVVLEAGGDLSVTPRTDPEPRPVLRVVLDKGGSGG